MPLRTQPNALHVYLSAVVGGKDEEGIVGRNSPTVTAGWYRDPIGIVCDRSLYAPISYMDWAVSTIPLLAPLRRRLWQSSLRV